MRAVIDTNVLIAGLLWRGPPHAMLTHVRNGLVSLISSPALLAELDDVLGRAKFDAILTRTNTARDQALAGGSACIPVLQILHRPISGAAR